MNEQFNNTLEEWNRRVTRATWGHHRAATLLRVYHYAIGIPLVALTATVGGVGGSVQSQYSFLVSPLSVIAAVLAGLQTFLGFSERAEAHKKAGAAYSAIRRELEHLATFPPADEPTRHARLDELRKRMDTLAEQCLGIPRTIWNAGEKKYDRKTFKSSVNAILQSNKP